MGRFPDWICMNEKDNREVGYGPFAWSGTLAGRGC